MGNPKAMQERQDRYAEQMKPFGLERGIRNTGIEHEDAKEYYARMKQSLESVKTDDLEAKRSVLGVDLWKDDKKTIENLKTALIAEKTANKSNTLTIDNLKKDKKTISKLPTGMKPRLKTSKQKNKI